MSDVRGLLIAFEGLDQSGKQTQAERLRDLLVARGRSVHLMSFPDYETPIGKEIGLALQGQRSFGPELMQMLFVANRHEWRDAILKETSEGGVVVCDRYIASSVAYGEAHGLDGNWLREIQRYLPKPDLTVLLDIAPETSASRKTAARDKYERDLELLARVRASYRAQATAPGWVLLNADRDREDLAAEIAARVNNLLESP